MLKCDFDSMIGDPPSQTFETNSQLLVTPHALPDGHTVSPTGGPCQLRRPPVSRSYSASYGRLCFAIR